MRDFRVRNESDILIDDDYSLLDRYKGCRKKDYKYIYEQHPKFCYDELFDSLGSYFAEIFDFNESKVTNLTYSELNGYADALYARYFEGLDLFYNFSDHQLKEIAEVNKWGLILSITNEQRKQWMDKLLSRPIHFINRTIDEHLKANAYTANETFLNEESGDKSD
mmetsp:Transcript_3189/g.5327  ORF Transcript_3189/g.5327 Transcript_3189/m.5327 type:complete len:165 (+) Transcript_3189:547-1041(+)|eukprot:CAMPEP_0168621698 /NCGR_PEP_ID=MMETSP0449_2-20121227/7844_1 /TAXON_ID=1082188 /ORGANISM="Strombidium rassoulzadegani, Strain ras09" /LENGTH=164 /DNA_ID=CAMNT_0008662857 /DNA_START=657 /DNA_END=1151 /DNA_ORIENTATION=-